MADEGGRQTYRKRSAPTNMEIVQQFQATSNDLIAVQRELAQLFRLSADPLLESQTSARRAELSARRDSLLDHWARLGLSWLLQGGGVQLVEAAPVVESATSPEQGASAPAMTPEPMPTVVVVAGPPTADRHGESPSYDRGMSPSWVRAMPPRPQPVDVERLREVLKGFDPPPTNITEEAQVREELRRLSDNTTPTAITAWLDFPKEVQRALVGMAVARARYVQDEISPALHPITIDQELDRFFSGMTAFSKREQPGFVFGLRRHHHPVAERWAEDAQRWWAELAGRLPEPITPNPERALNTLQQSIDDEAGDEEIVQRALEVLDAGVSADDPRFVRMMIPHGAKLGKHTRFKRLRKALRDMMTEDETIIAESESEESALPAGWVLREHVAGRHAAIVGGDLREDARKRIQDAFGFASLEWITTDHTRNLQSLASSVKNGGVDFVILLRRFIGHNVDQLVLPAARSAEVPWVSVERGYGIQQIKAAIERYLAQSAQQDNED